MNVYHEPATLDPRKGSEVVSSSLHFLLFEGLMRLNPDGTVTPAQAESVTISDDRTTYTFRLREAYWSNGSAVTATDFEYAWKKILSPDFPAPNAHLLYPIKNAQLAKTGQLPLDDVGIRAVNEKTLVVHLKDPTPYFLNLVSFCVFFPIHHSTDQINPHWMNEANADFICNGPFQLIGWKHHNEIALKKNNYYWEAHQINLDEILVTMISDETTALNMYENGDLDLIGMPYSPIPSDAYARFKKEGTLQTQLSPATSILCFNLSSFPFNNKNLRKAFAYAINRQAIVENITSLGEEAATNIIPPVLRNGESPSFFQDNDQALALACFKAGLDELGLTASQFPTLTYSYSYSDTNHRIAQVLQEQWQELFHINIELRNCNHKILAYRLSEHHFDIAQTFWIAQYNDPISILERFKYRNNGKNYPSWEHADYIRLLDSSAHEASDEARMKTLQAAEALLIEEMPLVPIYHWKTAFMLKDHLTCKSFIPTGAFELSRIQPKESEL